MRSVLNTPNKTEIIPKKDISLLGMSVRDAAGSMHVVCKPLILKNTQALTLRNRKTYFRQVFEVLIGNCAVLMLDLLHTHNVQLKWTFIRSRAHFVIYPSVRKLGKHVVYNRLVNGMKAKDMMFVVRIQYSITFQISKQIVKHGQYSLVNVPPQPLYPRVMDTAPCNLTSTRWSSRRMVKHIACNRTILHAHVASYSGGQTPFSNSFFKQL